MKQNQLAIAVALVLASLAFDVHANVEAKISHTILQRAHSGESVDVLITVNGSPSFRLLRPDLPFNVRASEVSTQLRAVAEVTQAPLLQSLKSQGIKSKSLWIVNVIAARLNASQLIAIAERDDVLRIESNAPNKNVLGVEAREDEAAQLAMTTTMPNAISAIEPNVTRVRAHEAWAMGYTGQNVVVAGQDTGYRWSHNALKNKYRGWNGVTVDHNFNWWDSIDSDIDGSSNVCGLSATTPCDDNGHGSHTMGTVLGDDGGANQVGVAPGAKWIGCRNMDAGTGRPFTYLECMQFFMAPTDLAGNNANPNLAPHVTNNSWGCPLGPPPSGEDCAVSSFNTALANSKAAGILTVVSAGNDGSGCSTVGAPPSYMADVFTVGAANNSDVIASFSSRGPATADGSNRLKPDVVGPGVSVRSAQRSSDTAYGTSSGTSMSGPSVAGVAALVMSANPELRGQPALVEDILRNTAVPLTSTQNCGSYMGAQIPNAVFGHGRVDAVAAVNMALAMIGIARPTLVGPVDQSLNEDQPSAVLPVAIDDPILDENAVTLLASSSNENLLANAGIALGGTGATRSIQLTPMPNFFGTVYVQMRFQGSNNFVARDSIRVDILPVNDKPSFAIAGNRVHQGVSGVQTVPGFVSAVNLGTNEISQQVASYEVIETSDSNSIVEAVQISTSGVLTYTLNGNSGVADIRVRLQDNGGTANSGVDFSDPLIFQISNLADSIYGNGFE